MQGDRVAFDVNNLGQGYVGSSEHRKMSGGREEAVIIADISGDGCAVLHSQSTKG